MSGILEYEVFDLQDRIGEVAGEVWDYLQEKGEGSLNSITEEVDASRSRVYMAIGWLAKEGKLVFEEDGRGNRIKLR